MKEKYTRIEVVEDGQGGLKAIAHLQRETPIPEIISNLERNQSKRNKKLLSWLKKTGFVRAYPIGQGFAYAVTADQTVYELDIWEMLLEKQVEPKRLAEVVRNLFVPEGDLSTADTPVVGISKLRLRRKTNGTKTGTRQEKEKAEKQTP